MGDYAVFALRLNEGVSCEDFKKELFHEDNIEGDIRDLKYDESLGLMFGLVKSSWTGGCKVPFFAEEYIEEFSTIGAKYQEDADENLGLRLKPESTSSPDYHAAFILRLKEGMIYKDFRKELAQFDCIIKYIKHYEGLDIVCGLINTPSILDGKNPFTLSDYVEQYSVIGCNCTKLADDTSLRLIKNPTGRGYCRNDIRRH